MRLHKSLIFDRFLEWWVWESCGGSWTLFLCKHFLLFQFICMASGHVTETLNCKYLSVEFKESSGNRNITLRLVCLITKQPGNFQSRGKQFQTDGGQNSPSVHLAWWVWTSFPILTIALLNESHNIRWLLSLLFLVFVFVFYSISQFFPFLLYSEILAQ